MVVVIWQLWSKNIGGNFFDLENYAKFVAWNFKILKSCKIVKL